MATRKGYADPISVWDQKFEIDHRCPYEDGDCYTEFLRTAMSLAVFFDHEKSQNTTWKYGILMKLYDTGS